MKRAFLLKKEPWPLIQFQREELSLGWIHPFFLAFCSIVLLSDAPAWNLAKCLLHDQPIRSFSSMTIPMVHQEDFIQSRIPSGHPWLHHFAYLLAGVFLGTRSTFWGKLGFFLVLQKMNLTRAHCVATTHLQDGFRILLTRGTQKLQFIYRNSKEQVFQGISILNSLNITRIFSYRGNQGKVTYMLILNWMWLLQLIIILTEEIGK